MNEINVKIKFLENNKEKKLPFYATKGSAGMDLTACIEEDIVLKPLERKLIPTGIAIKLPCEDYGAFLFARSGLAIKHGLAPANCVGVADSDYRGEYIVALHNDTDFERTIAPKERINTNTNNNVSINFLKDLFILISFRLSKILLLQSPPIKMTTACFS